MTGRLCFLDLETTGLQLSSGHECWEIGLIVRDEAALVGEYVARTDVEYLWRVQPDLTKADPEALRVGRYYERTKTMGATWSGGCVYNLAGLDEDLPLMWSDPAEVAYAVARLIDGAVVVGANPGFDKDMLRPFLHHHGQAHTAHYRPVCVTVAGWGYLCGQRARDGDMASVPELSWPLSSNEVSRALGVDPADFDRHSALGDCKWTEAQWAVITGMGV